MAAPLTSEATRGAAPRFASSCRCTRNACGCWRPRAPMSQPEKSRILIVDDDRPQREGLQRALAERFDVLLADDAEKALQVLEAQPVDVLLTDLKMPGEDGMRSEERRVGKERKSRWS